MPIYSDDFKKETIPSDLSKYNIRLNNDFNLMEHVLTIPVKDDKGKLPLYLFKPTVFQKVIEDRITPRNPEPPNPDLTDVFTYKINDYVTIDNISNIVKRQLSFDLDEVMSKRAKLSFIKTVNNEFFNRVIGSYEPNTSAEIKDFYDKIVKTSTLYTDKNDCLIMSSYTFYKMREYEDVNSLQSRFTYHEGFESKILFDNITVYIVDNLGDYVLETGVIALLVKFDYNINVVPQIIDGKDEFYEIIKEENNDGFGEKILIRFSFDLSFGSPQTNIFKLEEEE